MTVLDPSTFDSWVIESKAGLAMLTDAAANQDWTAVTRSLDVLDALMAERPDGDPAAASALLTTARQTIDELRRRAASERDTVAGELRQLATGRKALKAYA